MTKEELQRQIESKYLISIDKFWHKNTLVGKVRIYIHPHDIVAVVKFGKSGLGTAEEMRNARYFFTQQAQEEFFLEVKRDENHPYLEDYVDPPVRSGWDYDAFVDQYLENLEKENAHVQRRAGQTQSRSRPSIR